jgi:hypothetical protein
VIDERLAGYNYSMLAVAFLTCIQAYTFLAFRIYPLMENARAIQIVDECVVEEIFPPLQPARTSVLACQGMDVIWQWSLLCRKIGLRITGSLLPSGDYGQIGIILIRALHVHQELIT